MFMTNNVFCIINVISSLVVKSKKKQIMKKRHLKRKLFIRYINNLFLMVFHFIFKQHFISLKPRRSCVGNLARKIRWKLGGRGSGDLRRRRHNRWGCNASAAAKRTHLPCFAEIRHCHLRWLSASIDQDRCDTAQLDWAAVVMPYVLSYDYLI